MTELAGLRNNPITGVSMRVALSEDGSQNFNRLIATFEGPKDGPYEGYDMDVVFSMDNYPNVAPSTHFDPPIYHTNVTMETGTPCDAAVGLNPWSPTSRLREVLEAFQSILVSSVQDDRNPRNAEAAVCMASSPEEFCKRIADRRAAYMAARAELLCEEKHRQAKADEARESSGEEGMAVGVEGRQLLESYLVIETNHKPRISPHAPHLGDLLITVRDEKDRICFLPIMQYNYVDAKLTGANFEPKELAKVAMQQGAEKGEEIIGAYLVCDERRKRYAALTLEDGDIENCDYLIAVTYRSSKDGSLSERLFSVKDGTWEECTIEDGIMLDYPSVGQVMEFRHPEDLDFRCARISLDSFNDSLDGFFAFKHTGARMTNWPPRCVNSLRKMLQKRPTTQITGERMFPTAEAVKANYTVVDARGKVTILPHGLAELRHWDPAER